MKNMKYLPLKSTMNGLLFKHVLRTRTAFLFVSIFVGLAVVIVDAVDVSVFEVDVAVDVIVVDVVVVGIADVVVPVVDEVVVDAVVVFVLVVVVVKQPAGWSLGFIILKSKYICIACVIKRNYYQWEHYLTFKFIETFGFARNIFATRVDTLYKRRSSFS